MTTVSVSPKFQIIIPRQVREALDIQPGQRIPVIPYQKQIELIPLRPFPSPPLFHYNGHQLTPHWQSEQIVREKRYVHAASRSWHYPP